MKASTAAVCGVILICAFMGVFGWLAIRHVDTQQFLYVFGTIVSINAGILFNIVKTAKLEEKVDKVVNQTNGQMSALIEKMEPMEGSQAAHDAVQKEVKP